MFQNLNSFLGLFILPIFTLILYYGTKLLVERKYKLHVGSIGFLSINDIEYSNIASGPNQHTFKASTNKIHLHIRRPHSGRKTWITLTINDLKIKLSSIKFFTQVNSHRRKPSLISSVPQNAWWSSVWIVKFTIAKISAIPLQFVIAALSNYFDIYISKINISAEDLGQFELNDISLAIVFPYLSSITISSHLSPTCTSLLSFEIGANFTEIDLNIDSLLRLLNSLKNSLPKKTHKRDPKEALRNAYLKLGLSRTFSMATLTRKLIMSRRRKKTPIEFLGLDLSVDSTINGFLVKLEQRKLLSKNAEPNLFKRSIFGDGSPEPVELLLNISIDNVECDLINQAVISQMLQVSKVNSIFTFSKPLVLTPDLDPNSLSLRGTWSQLKFGFQDIVLDINGDYTELNDLSASQHKKTLERRYNNGWAPPDFSMVYNLIVSFKSRKMRLHTLDKDLLINHSWEINMVSSALGSITSYTDDKQSSTFAPSLQKESFQVHVNWTIDGIEISLCDKGSFNILKQLLTIFGNDENDNHISSEGHHSETSALLPPSQPSSTTANQSLIIYAEVLKFHFSLNSMCIRVAGADCYVDASTSRGFEIGLQEIVIEYQGVRASIDQNSTHNQENALGPSTKLNHDNDNTVQGFLKGFKITPILALWDHELIEKTKPLISIPEIKLENILSIKLLNNDCKFAFNTSVKIHEIYLLHSLLYHYCFIVAFMNVINLFPKSLEGKAMKSSGSNKEVVDTKFNNIELNLTLDHININIDLPEDTKLFVRLNGVNYRFVSPIVHSVSIKETSFFGTSPIEQDLWDEIINIKNIKVLHTEDDTKKAKKKLAKNNLENLIRLQADVFNFRVPYKYIIADLTENLANEIKSIKQLHSRINDPTALSIPDPEEEGPKVLPTIQIKIATLIFKIDDDPFEAKLSNIWKLGYLEQRTRLERDKAFELKVERLKSDEQNQLSKDDADLNNDEPHKKPINRNSDPLTDKQEESSDNNPKKSRQPIPTSRANLRIEAAQAALNQYNSKSWITRVKADQDTLLWHKNTDFSEDSLPISTTEPSRYPALLKITIDKLLLTISTVSFPLEQLPQYMYDIGKGLPLDTKFTLLVPMNLNCKLKEAWVQIRDYPLPLAHIPSHSPHKGKKDYSCVIEGNLVVGEELRGEECLRKPIVEVISPRILYGENCTYKMTVPRTCSPVKLYSNFQIKITSSKPTVFSWGISMQPAIQHMAKVFESTGDVHFFTKGTRDPYLITGHGSGFVLSWRQGIEIRLGFPNNQKEVLQVSSEGFLLGIPDLVSVIADGSLSADNLNLPAKKLQGETIDGSETSTIEIENILISKDSQVSFLKTLMRLSGGVRYGMGIDFHRSCRYSEVDFCKTCDGKNKCRYKDFIPHYKVITRVPEYAFVYDSFRGFRSNLVHISVSVTCPLELNLNDRSEIDDEKKVNKNSIQLSPKALQHVLAWAFLFEPAMSIPVRQGDLFPSLEPPTVKLGKFIQSVKIKVCVGPLYLSHFYRQDNIEDLYGGMTQLIGIKAKIEYFKLDIHLQAQEKIIQLIGKEVKGREILLHEAEVDLKDLDLRGISVKFIEENGFPGSENHEPEKQESDETTKTHVEDEIWIDDDEYVELDCKLPDAKPVVHIYPHMKSPQMMYYKRPDIQLSEQERKFDHDTHVCIMGQGRVTHQIQIDFLNDRLNQISNDIIQLDKLSKDIKQKITAHQENPNIHNVTQSIQDATLVLSKKHNLIQDYINNLEESLNKDMNVTKFIDTEDVCEDEDDCSNFDSPTWADSHEKFGHQFVIHNAEAIWNNSLRNLIYKLWDLIEQNQGLTYYMSMRAVKFIRDLQKIIQQRADKEILLKPQGESYSFSDDPVFDASMAAEMLRKLVGEKNTNFVVLNETLEDNDINKKEEKNKNAYDNIPEGYSLRENYIVELINPQINFQSDKNPGASIIMCIERAQLQTFSIVEDCSIGDFINEVVKTRTFFGLDNAQFFTAVKNDFRNYLSRISTANNYGAKGQENWPVWVPIEGLISNTKKNALPFQRVVRRTSATMQYDKFNNLRIKGVGDVTEEDSSYTKLKNAELEKDEFHKRMDTWKINFPRFHLSATSAQYNIFLDVITDLLMYREPAMKERSERLNTILLAADLDNLSGAAERVLSLQEKIRHLTELKRQYQLYLADLGERGAKELRAVEIDLMSSQEELYILMEAITASQQRKQMTESKMALKAVVSLNKVVWEMQKSDRTPFCEWELSNAYFEWTTKEENSTLNFLEIDHVHLINKLPSPIFTQLICPYIPTDNRRPFDFSRTKMLRVYWSEMEPVGGIDIIEHFEINLFPLKFQMQYDVGKLIMAYIFPEKEKAYMIKEGGPDFADNISLNFNSQISRNNLISLNNAEFIDIKDKVDEIELNKNVAEEQRMTVVQNNNPAHDLVLMKNRASQNKTFVYIKVPSVTLNFSYQGAKEKNFEDIYNFVFRMPTLEYQNRTWSWLNLLEQVKKDLLRTILSHTGALLEKIITQKTQKRIRPNTTTSDLDMSSSPSTSEELSSNINNGHNSLIDKSSINRDESQKKSKDSMNSKTKINQQTNQNNNDSVHLIHNRKESCDTVTSETSISTRSTTISSNANDDAEIEEKA
ncbi:6400_t:CDS:10, partial [Entrophospora sp. SA101]